MVVSKYHSFFSQYSMFEHLGSFQESANTNHGMMKKLSYVTVHIISGGIFRVNS